MHDLYAATLATVHLAVRDGIRALYINRIPGRRSEPMVSKIGSRPGGGTGDTVADLRRVGRAGLPAWLTVDEIVDVLTAHDTGGSTCASERWRLEQVEARIEARMAALRRIRRVIRDTLAACDAGQCRLAGSEDTAAASAPGSIVPPDNDACR